MADHDSNPDPITKAPGAHPTGVGIGAAAGGATGAGAAIAAGAAAGSVAGPIGTAIGIIAGAVVGGYVGKGIGEKVDPTEDVEYWRGAHKDRPYAANHTSHDYDRDLAPAYRYGSTIGMGMGEDYDRPLSTTGSTAGTSASAGSASTGSRRYEDHENDIRAGWDQVKGKSSLTYDHARDAIRDAFDRRANTSGGARSTTSTTGR